MASTALLASTLCEIQLTSHLVASYEKRRAIPATEALIDSARWLVVQVIQSDGTAVPFAQVAGEIATSKVTSATRVMAHGHLVGMVTRIWANGDGQMTHILLREPPPRFAFLRGQRYEYILPVTEAVALSSDGQIVVDQDVKAVKQLPIFRADADIERDVQLALEEALAIPQFIHAVNATVEDGTVYLSGFVDFRARRELAEHAVRTVPGVRDIINDIIAEDELMDRVEAALERTLQRPECAGATVSVHIEHAIATLTGEAPSNAARRALEEAAIAVPGVRVVVNQIKVAGRREDLGIISTHNR